MLPWRRKNDNGNIKDEEQDLGGPRRGWNRRPTQVGVFSCAFSCVEMSSNLYSKQM